MTHKKRTRFSLAGSLLSFAAGALLVIAGASATRARAAHRSAIRPASSAGAKEAPALVADKGKFRILVNGQEVGKEEFEIAPNSDTWVARGSSEIQSSQGATHITGTLALRPDGTPVRYDWSTQSSKKASASISFNGPTANIELRIEGARPFTQQFTFDTPHIAVLDNNLYHQYAILARFYDWNKKGAQTIAVLVPQEMTPGKVTLDSLGKQDVHGRKLEGLSVKTEDNEVDLYLEGDRLVRIVAPAANAEIVRE